MNARIQEVHDLNSREFREAMALYHETFQGSLAETTESIAARLRSLPTGREHLLAAASEGKLVGFTLSSYVVTKNYGFISYICAHP
ncbi:hypothetical protein [Effusibacillus consociatus]